MTFYGVYAKLAKFSGNRQPPKSDGAWLAWLPGLSQGPCLGVPRLLAGCLLAGGPAIYRTSALLLAIASQLAAG